jgi:hypothetical protein
MKKALLLSCCFMVLGLSGFAQTPTWAQDIAPILYSKCTSCHHPGGLAPFPLLSYSDALNNAAVISTNVTSKTMPPWPPDANYRHYVQERALSQNEIDAINSWVASGSPQGDITHAPSQPIYNNASQLGTYDMSVQMPAYTVGGIGDQHRNFPIPSNLPQDVYVTAVEIIPGNPAIVHHVIFYQDTTNTPYLLDSADTGPGYQTIGLNSTARMIMAYTPGNGPYYPPVGTGVRLFKNTTLVIQVHYPDGSQGMVDSTRVNFKFSSVPQREITMWVLPGQKNMINGPIHIPPNQYADYHERDTLTTDLTLLAVMPHMHLLGRTIKNWAYSPITNDTIKLASINNWQFHWQGNYFFNNTVKLSSGTILEAEATYDNTSNNHDNPNNPPQLVVEGPGTEDEMMCIVASYMPYQPGDEYLITNKRLTIEGAPVICQGHAVVLKAVQGSDYLYQWYKDNNPISAANSYSYNATLPGSYYARISLGPNTAYSDTVSIINGFVPSANIESLGSTALCAGASVTLSADTGSNYRYQWFNDNLLLGGETASSLVVDQAGSYSVQVYSGCYSVSNPVAVTNVTCSGIDQLDEGRISISPNPSNGTFEINGISGHLLVYDAQGRVVYEDKNLSGQKSPINLQHISPGCYVARLTSQAGTFYRKLLIER